MWMKKDGDLEERVEKRERNGVFILLQASLTKKKRIQTFADLTFF
jgi:hypothetical protein